MSIGIATILSSRGAQKLKYRPKYVENGGHFENQDGRQKEMASNFLSTFIAIHEITNIGIAIILTSILGSEIEI